MMLGSAAAGAYRVALTVIEALAKPAELLTRSFYPEIARLWVAGEHARFWTVALRATMLSVMFGLAVAIVIFVAGPVAVTATMGAAFAATGMLLRVMAWAPAGLATIFLLESTLFALGRAGHALAARTVASFSCLALLAVATTHFGIEGAGYAYVAGTILLIALQLLWLRGATSE